MIKRNKDDLIDVFYKKCENIIEEEIKQGHYERAMAAIALCAGFQYHWNQCYTSTILEQYTLKLAKILRFNKIYEGNADTVDEVILFYDGFGYDTRGLALIYLKALACSGKKIIYVTKHSVMDKQPTMKQELEGRNVKWVHIPMQRTYMSHLHALYKVMKKYSFSKAFIYTHPNDVAGIIAFMSLNKRTKRYIINLTDHAFWLGVNAFDFCIEFREYGASISYYNRGIPKDKLIMLPYYPYINHNFNFEGFPFNNTEKKIVFSGGSLYKTFDEKNIYYMIVDALLKKNEDMLFLYAGHGDSSKLIEMNRKYPKRVFHIGERKDLYQLMQNVTLYLNTYPLLGGLMTQYAASAKKIPITLCHENDGDGLLINQEKRSIEYDSAEELIEDVTKLLQDKEYLSHREEKLKGSVISEQVFSKQLDNALSKNKTDFDFVVKQIDTSSFIESYIKRFKKEDIYTIVARKRNLCLFFKFPLYFIIGVPRMIIKKFKQILSL